MPVLVQGGSVGVKEQSNGSDITTTAYGPKGSVGCGNMSAAVLALFIIALMQREYQLIVTAAAEVTLLAMNHRW